MSSAIQAQDEGFQYWLAQINQVCGDFGAKTLGSSFIGSIQEFQQGAIRLSEVAARQVHLYRSARELNAGSNAHCYAVFQLEGQCLLEQDGQRVALTQGDITLLDASRPSALSFPEHSRQFSLILPHQVLARSMRFTQLACARRIAAQTPLAMLANSLLHEIRRQQHWELYDSEATLDALVALLKPALGGTQEESDSHTRLFEKALAYIDTHLVEEDLCPERVARAVGASTRGLYRLFAKKGVGVSQYIRNRRLDLCAEALRNPRGETKLSSLGLEYGFSDSSHFFTAFKTRFGASPGEYRKRYA